MTARYDKYIDAKGLKCPQPLLMAKRWIDFIEPNQVLMLEATDAHTDLDLEVWCERFGHEIIHTENSDNTFKFWIRRKADDKT